LPHGVMNDVHFRDKDKNEVDIVLENRRGQVVGIEVKASATVSSKDFAGMRKLADTCGSKFVQGLVLYENDQVVPFADNMLAAPPSSCGLLIPRGIKARCRKQLSDGRRVQGRRNRAVARRITCVA